MTDELKKALEALKGHKMSEHELNQQRISFAYGNAPKEDKGTKDAVQRASRAEISAAA